MSRRGDRSGIDANIPELPIPIADTFDALGSTEGAACPTAPALRAPSSRMPADGQRAGSTHHRHSRLSAAPRARRELVLHHLRSLNYAAAHGAQIVNMSFAGPKDAGSSARSRRPRRAAWC